MLESPSRPAWISSNRQKANFMPNLSFNCPHCQKALEVPEHLVGGTIACPGCKGQISLQAAAPAQSASAPAAPTLRTPPAVKQKPAASPPAKASAPIVFNCESCGAELEADADQADTVIDCPKCESTICVPASGGRSVLHLKKKAMTRQCPECRAQLPVAAPVCQYCGVGANAAIQHSLDRTAANVQRTQASSGCGTGVRWGLVIPGLLGCLALAFWLLCGIFVIQPIGAIPDGTTIVYWRHGTSMPFIASADGLLASKGEGVSLLGRGVVLAALAKPIKEKEIFRLGYSETIYLWSTGGKKYEE